MANAYLSQLKFRKGDLNGFIQLFFDNLATLLALIFFLQDVLRGFGNADLAKAQEGPFADQIKPINAYINEIIYQRTVPGLAITMIFGNVYYTFMGARLNINEDRDDENFATALPYGVNTPGAFAFLFSIIGPASLVAGFACDASTVTDENSAIAYRQCWENAAESGWKAGVVSNFIAGLISVVLGFAGKVVLKFTPTLALLTSLAGIGFTFLGIVQASQSYSEPLVGLLPFWLTAVAYFGNVSFGPIPKSLAVAVVGIALGWADGLRTGDDISASVDNLKWWGVDTGFRALGDWSGVDVYIGTVFPVALAAAAGTLMNVLSAEQAGDSYGVMETMISDGVGTIVGALFGTPFGTSVYIGHPAYKKMGAGIVYSLINCLFYFIFAMFGIFALINAFVPATAVAPLIFFVGIMICEDAIKSAKHPRYYPAFLIGLFPSLTDWAVVGGLSYAGIGGTNYYGFVSMSKGSLLLALVSSCMMYYIIDRNFLPAIGWTVFAAVLSAFGLLHQESAQVGEGWTKPQDLYCKHPSNSDGSCPAGYESCFSPGGPMCAPYSTVKWRFMTGYFTVAAMLVGFYILQRMGKVDPQEEVEEDDENVENSKVAANL